MASQLLVMSFIRKTSDYSRFPIIHIEERKVAKGLILQNSTKKSREKSIASGIWGIELKKNKKSQVLE